MKLKQIDQCAHNAPINVNLAGGGGPGGGGGGGPGEGSGIIQTRLPSLSR